MDQGQGPTVSAAYPLVFPSVTGGWFALLPTRIFESDINSRLRRTNPAWSRSIDASDFSGATMLRAGERTIGSFTLLRRSEQEDLVMLIDNVAKGRGSRSTNSFRAEDGSLQIEYAPEARPSSAERVVEVTVRRFDDHPTWPRDLSLTLVLDDFFLASLALWTAAFFPAVDSRSVL
jgi:hypothetical protein